MASFPRLILWSWERPDDLRFLDQRSVGVAFLARSFTLRGDDVVVRPRMQPLRVPPGAMVIAVARIEADLSGAPALSSQQGSQLASGIAELARLPDIRAVQVDFDAKRSEREFYRAVLIDLRRRLPESMPLSITALASWCMGDNWLNGLPIDEAVPMLFEMGPDSHAIDRSLESGREFNAPACRSSVGLSANDALRGVGQRRRVYLFPYQSWKPSDVERIAKQLEDEP